MYKILVKYPTKSRPDLFLKTLSEYIQRAVNNHAIQYLVSIDEDDVSMTEEVIEKAKALHQNVVVYKGQSKNKIQACNADIEKAKHWDICLLISDDMQVGAYAWDDRIRKDMNQFFPDTDGCLWYHDGAQKHICTLSCVGRNYFGRFGYLYHPSYKSFFCDNEFTDIALKLGKMRFFQTCLIRHQHPAWVGHVQEDALYKNNNQYWAADEANYKKRMAVSFI